MTRRAFGCHRCRGATLVIVLALVTVVSILLIAYLGTVQFERSATQNYGGELSADQIAMGGLDRQVADLEQEIAAGSTAVAGPSSTSPTYYKPLTNLTMVPARYNDEGYDYTNVIRVSSTNATYYDAAYPTAIYTGPLPVNLAVASSTTNMSPDGRFISAARWQAPQLLLPTETNAGTMPIPDWILMTRSGPTNAAGLTFGGTGNTLNNRASSNPNYVVGRYAYIVYNEGGLLDVTVAGASNGGTNAPTADDIGNRGSLAMAALTNSTFTPTQMAALSAWRNAGTATSESNYTNYVYSVQSTNGFLQAQPGDNTFLSRQDLISYANYAGVTSALPYLGTFNRAVNAPAYTPANITATNPDLLTLRYSNAGTINSGGKLLKSRTVQAGDFLLSRRFPLNRLSWVGYNGLANGASAQDVWRAFGLVWDSNNYAWSYVSGSGSTLPSATAIVTSIKSLSAVAQENPPREPDFFELLQAGILNGSLGQTAGAQASFTDSSGGDNLYGGSGDTSGYDSVQSYHVMQIGVNIIDQAKVDSFPTAIEFGADPRDAYVSSQTSNTGARTFYGVKNLPYISRIVDTAVRWTTPPSPLSNTDKSTFNPPFPGTNYFEPYVGCWEQIELWNPHQSTATTPDTSSTNYPAALRITAIGRIHGVVYSRKNTTNKNEYQATTFAPGTGANGSSPAETTWANTNSYIQLNAPGIRDFSEPKLVSTNDVTTATANCMQTGTFTTGASANGANGTPFVGLYVGSAYAPDWAYCATNTSPATQYPTATTTNATPTFDPACMSYNTLRINPYAPVADKQPPGVTYEMQYLDPASNTYRTYGLVKNQTVEADGNFDPSTVTVSKSTITRISTWTILSSDSNARFDQKIDPRTDRFSTSKGRGGDTGVNSVDTPPLIDDTMRPDTGIGHSSDTCIPYGASAWFGNNAANTPPSPGTAQQPFYYLGGLMENTTSSTTYYKDPDGTLRRGDAAYNNSTSSDGHPGIRNNLITLLGVNLARPVFLNRPFRSVGELGYVGRDLPWKTLDFFTKDSGDAGLLDLFSVSDADIVAGTIDLNTHNAQALAEVLGGGAINPNHMSDTAASPLTPTQASTLANDFITATTTLPLRSRAEMVTSALDPSTGETILSTDGGFIGQSAKIQREAAVRALSEVSNARTWNLLIDIIAQSGRYSQSLAPGASYDSFVPDGEKRYWLHIAIDRYTGKVIDRFLEPVQE